MYYVGRADYFRPEIDMVRLELGTTEEEEAVNVYQETCLSYEFDTSTG